MSMLPDDLWNRIMEIGIGTKSLDYKDICRLSVTCRGLRLLAGDDSVWSPLLLSDFASSSKDLNLIKNDGDCIGNNNRNSDSTVSAKFKSLYKIRYFVCYSFRLCFSCTVLILFELAKCGLIDWENNDRYEKEVKHRRFLLRIESEIAERLRQIQERVLQSAREKEKMNETIAELRNLRQAR
ncbi:hypothetical protein BUALT_Bualt12G0053900 [Buddleja alternifolia]|uniref:F-box domain-containing protein n=1 Tax=Buddleja alternifolia TaxID=168488 RepID=A0AAV6WTP3_9LAMI|nr:hypothetical protein BUALT_Bualt12G0053900 [Buddleja alternifolia]